MGDLSELEGAVLGLTWRRGPLTAHAVRSVFAESPAPFFSGSEGSIYAVVRRLEGRGLLRGEDRPGDGRAARDLSATDAGVTALKAWLRFEDWMAGPTPDPLRTRVLFAGVLSSGQRGDLLAQAERTLEGEVEEGRARIGACDDEASRAAARGALAVAEARLSWTRDEISRLQRA